MSDPKNMDAWFEGTPGVVEPKERLVSRVLKEGGDAETLFQQKHLNLWLNYAFSENGGTSYDRPLVNLLRGVRVLGPGNQMAPIPDDTIGLVFMSRPLLNLSDDNVRRHPQLLSLISPPSNSLHAYVKGLLDFNWGKSYVANNAILNNDFAWIAPVTNLVKNSSGFPDVSLNVGKSEPGLRKEVRQYPEGILKVNWDYDIRMTFHNPKPNILPYIFDVWNHYIEGVLLGDEGMEPYPEALIQNYRDYDTRIYHIILNKDMRHIEGIYMTGYSWPNTFPSGSFSTIDTTSNTLRGQGQDELDINFPSVAFRYNNVRVAKAFNDTTYYFNKQLKPEVINNKYRKLAFKEYYSSGIPAYPIINLETMEFEWWSLK